jgi:hypothetical protein
MTNEPDIFDALATPSGDAPPELRDRVRTATLDCVRRRRRMRRAAQIAAGAGLAAIVVFAVWATRPRSTPAETKQESAQVPQAPRQAPAAKVEDDPAAGSALALEWQAFDSQTERARRYFQAGDRYLEAEEDYVSAVRCYSQALASARPEEIRIAPDDNWLVVTLKRARLQEMTQ